LQVKYNVDHISKIDGVVEKIIDKRKLFKNINDLSKLFSDKKCLLVSKEYTNYDSPLYFICLKHADMGVQKTTYHSFRHDSYCKYCGYEKTSNKNLYPYEYVKKIFEEHDCELLSKEYKGVNEVLHYRCNKHPKHIQEVTLNSFKNNIGKKMSSDLETFLTRRDNLLIKEMENLQIMDDLSVVASYIVNTIMMNGDAVGLVVIFSTDKLMTENDKIMTEITTRFLEKYLEV
jgi:hypothetical protein